MAFNPGASRRSHADAQQGSTWDRTGRLGQGRRRREAAFDPAGARVTVGSGYLFGCRQRFEIRCNRRPALVEVDAGELQHVTCNLIVRRDFVADGGIEQHPLGF